jgi:hypothetical protein
MVLLQIRGIENRILIRINHCQNCNQYAITMIMIYGEKGWIKSWGRGFAHNISEKQEKFWKSQRQIKTRYEQES